MNSEEFISRAKKLVLENLLNSQFGVRMLAKELGISRSELYKRIKAAENKSASQFIREIRLERALALLNTGSYSMGEIAYMVGFNSPTYFSTSFKEYFGYTPSISKQHGDILKSEKIPKTKKRTIPLVLGGIAILILVFWSVGALGGSQSAKENTIDVPNRRISLEAYKLYVEARELGEQRVDSSLSKAIDLLEQAVELDPSFAEAYAELSYLYGQWHYYGSIKKFDRDKMMAKNVKVAMDLNPESPEVLLANADFDWKNKTSLEDSAAIISSFRKVLDKDPFNHRANYRMHQVYRWLGKYNRAHAHLETAAELDPRNYFYQSILARDLFWKKNEREKALSIIEEVRQNSSIPGGVYFNALMTAENANNGHVKAFKIIHEALKEQRYTYGYLYWGILLAMDLDMLPLAKKYSQLIQIRYPENTYYTYEPAFAICIAEGRYEDALDLTIIWESNKGLREDVALARIAKVHLLKGDTNISEQILMDQFTGLFENIELGNFGPENITSLDINPIKTYIEVLRKKKEHRKADVFADLLCSYYEAYNERNSMSKKLDEMDCFYLYNNVDGFLNRVRKNFFHDQNRLSLFKNLKSSRYVAFEDNIEYQYLTNEIKKETHRMRAEVIEYLRAAGDWESSWDDTLFY